MKGKLFCIGVGPGDPELLTLKAVKYSKRCPVWAVPQGNTEKLTAKSILLDALQGIDGVEPEKKEIITLHFPMTRDRAVLAAAHRKGAAAIAVHLEAGRDVALFTLGCPTVYASSIYVHRRLRDDGYETEIVPGVPSFCAAAAALQQPLCEKEEPLVIFPGGRADRQALLQMPGNTVIMKPAGQLAAIKAELTAAGKLAGASMVERCGLPGERRYPSLADAEENTYFSVILVHEEGRG
ncbi:precorrin-2 C(20)-methyltransferase [Megasphaera vaginalis (ex Srinivasan et al. 2021)]|uniref:Precorrin-2 C(20)-methyltransferase n=1 Tax=Megasphaera vaginalis (ex Srinivasan et al. 2021) TaxID=1111454 RepID=U7UTK6_9FIRM|nr:precorrin-2 C(20)-methyltransferase [Megasphaera vaginalis (ex Srinivasan et al. 2021)]ERT61798.1 precorrin-2 C(20)-methyltransferase [Megasphaera vaginalis (ex Srinivasan et al. 2021)]